MGDFSCSGNEGGGGQNVSTPLRGGWGHEKMGVVKSSRPTTFPFCIPSSQLLMTGL